MNSSEREGWYLNDATGLVQWWDGRQWAEPTAPPQQVATTAYQPVGCQPAETQPAPPLPPYVPQQFPAPQQFPIPQQVPPVYAPVRVSAPARNRLSLTAILIAVLYLLVDLVSGALILGVVPIVYSILAFRRKEKLAPVALACAVVVLVVGFALRGH